MVVTTKEEVFTIMETPIGEKLLATDILKNSCFLYLKFLTKLMPWDIILVTCIA